MYSPLELNDDNIVSFNQDNSTVLLRKGKKLYTIDLRICADNFKNNHKNASDNCVGDRNTEQKYFVFYTNEKETFIRFRKLYTSNLFRKKMLHGNRTQRFLQLQKIITKLGYCTYDLT